ncbi:MBL fold metallo-hydrolase [Lusitaniella coriacea]|uniref:MBL fold metallo-hydrolase n=1 Tax=Lusitaniella coriacea TaxID=1983105 RepID=UPI003CF9A6FF
MNPMPTASSNRQNPLSCFPYGVGRDSEGVCLLVQMGPYRILLDCGLKDLSPFLATETPPADLVLCTHAHADHARGLLELHERFPSLPIYASEVTARLLPLNWLELEGETLSSFCRALSWRSAVEVLEGLTVELFPAGHLPGATAILLTYTKSGRAYTVLYTGDFFLSNSRLVEGLSIDPLRGLSPDVLIIEGSYGTARHPRRRQQEKQLVEKIDRAIANQMSVLLPVPPLGLGQEILMLLRSHHQFTGRDLDIWVDTEVATACDIYLDLLPALPTAVQNFAKHQPLFWDEQVLPRTRRLPSSLEEKIQLPCIILTDLTADWSPYCSPALGTWVVLLPERPQLDESSTLEKVLRCATTRLSWETYLLAEHSDGRNTIQLIHNIRPQHVIFVHGSPTYLADLTSLEELQSRYQLHSPAVGTLVELPIGDTFIQPAAPTETNYEGELNEFDTAVQITLPTTIIDDPHWRHFADTGLIEARWQGEELVLRGLSQRELLSQSSSVKFQMDVDCCRNCRHQRGQRCWNPASPLYDFKVTPEGYCPAFESAELRRED